MKTKVFAFLAPVALLASSCSHEVYNNKGYLASHPIDGKKLAVLPVEVYYTGIQPKSSDWYAEEQAASLNLQSQLEQAYLLHTNGNKPKKHQHNVQMIDAHTVNDRLRTKMADLRTAWTIAPDSAGRMIGADLVFKVRLTKQRYMSKDLAKGINTGAFLLEGLLNSGKNKDVTLLPRVDAEDIAYDISLIDALTGEVISRYINDPEKSYGDHKIREINKKMAAQSAVYASK